MLGWIVFSAFEPYKRIDLEQITLTDFYIESIYKNVIQNVNFREKYIFFVIH